MSKTLRQLKEDLSNLIGEVTIDGKTGEIEDDNSSKNKNLQRTPKNTKSAGQQPNMSQQKQLPPPASNNQKALPPPQTKAMANPSKVPVVVPSKNVAVPLQAKPNLPATQEKKPEEKYMGKIEPEKKASPSITNKPEVKSKPGVPPETTDGKPETKPTSDDKPEVKSKPGVPPKSTKVSPKSDHIVKSGETPPQSSSKPGVLSKVKSALNAPTVDLRPTRARVGPRYSGPEHLVKQPSRSFRTPRGIY